MQRMIENDWSTWGLRPEALARVAKLLAAEPAVHERLAAVAARDSETVVSAGGGVAVLPLRGMLTATPSLISLIFGGGGGLQAFRANLREALASSDVQAIVLNVDSPGGSTDLITETAAEIRDARGEKPIVAVANTMAASAAYWLASQADELVITPSGEVGSIGVFALHWDESALNEKIGIEPTFISAGRFKVEGNPFEPLADEAKGAIQETVDDFYGLFVADVAQGRGVSADMVRGGFGEGRMVTAQRAVSLGMADRVETLEATVSRLSRETAPETRLISSSVQPDDKPDPNERQLSEEDRARIGAVLAARPRHTPTKE